MDSYCCCYWLSLLLYFKAKTGDTCFERIFLENLLLLPVAWWSCQYFGQVDNPFDYSMIELLSFFGMGILGAAGMLCMLYASRVLPITLFGLLGYLEPPLILAIGVILLNEPIHRQELPTYLLIFLALLILALNGLRQLKYSRKRRGI